MGVSAGIARTGTGASKGAVVAGVGVTVADGTET